MEVFSVHLSFKAKDLPPTVLQQDANISFIHYSARAEAVGTYTSAKSTI